MPAVTGVTGPPVILPVVLIFITSLYIKYKRQKITKPELTVLLTIGWIFVIIGTLIALILWYLSTEAPVIPGLI